MAMTTSAATNPTRRTTDANTRARLRRATRSFTLARPSEVSGLYERLARSRSRTMSWSGIVTLRDSAVVVEKGPEAVVCRMDRRFHGSLSTAHCLGYVPHGQVCVVPKHDGETLARRQLTECSDHRQSQCDIFSGLQSFYGPDRGPEGAMTAALISSRLANSNDEDPARWPFNT